MKMIYYKSLLVDCDGKVFIVDDDNEIVWANDLSGFYNTRGVFVVEEYFSEVKITANISMVSWRKMYSQ